MGKHSDKTGATGGRIKEEAKLLARPERSMD